MRGADRLERDQLVADSSAGPPIRRPSCHVTDGAAAMTWQDGQRIGGPALESAAGWVTFQAIGALTGADRPRVLEDRVAQMRAPLLLISAGSAAEHDFNVLYERAAGGPVEHWNVPGLEHTRVLRTGRRSTSAA